MKQIIRLATVASLAAVFAGLIGAAPAFADDRHGRDSGHDNITYQRDFKDYHGDDQHFDRDRRDRDDHRRYDRDNRWRHDRDDRWRHDRDDHHRW